MNPRVAVIGGGPGGLFVATLLRRRHPACEVVLFERNQAEDAFGFGVVFSDATLRRIDEADPVLRIALAEHGRHWERIEVWSRGERHGFSGNGMAAIHRQVLLRLLQENATAAGVDLRFGRLAPAVDELAKDYDLVIGADGTNSSVRDHLGEVGHTVETASAKFIWFGTTHLFDGLTFVHRASEHGNFAVHGYPISDHLSTFIVETDEQTWRRAGMDGFDISQPPGPSDVASQEYLEKLFAEDIGGASLVSNNSRWGNFRTRRTAQWYRDNVVLLGDAVHTAHFSVGSGTKMAMEDAVTLAEELADVFEGTRDLEEALNRYHTDRAKAVAKIQDAARPSLAWWERFGDYQQHLDPLTFTFHFFSRSIGIDKIEQRDPVFAHQVRSAWEAQHGTSCLRSSVPIGGVGPSLTRGCVLRESRETASEHSGAVHLVDGDDRPLDLSANPSNANVVPLVVAPDREEQVAAAITLLPTSGAVAIAGDHELTKHLLSEGARLNRGLTTILVGDYDDVAAETLLLSGRSDAVAVVGGHR
jgi:2-polyprenyl-6-methoxyphenol hydroxylase-like FAD-dependent oxidoreductase